MFNDTPAQNEDRLLGVRQMLCLNTCTNKLSTTLQHKRKFVLYVKRYALNADDVPRSVIAK